MLERHIDAVGLVERCSQFAAGEVLDDALFIWGRAGQIHPEKTRWQ
ncbi:hypothetical protein EBESD8_23850 [Rhodococcus aetherivorans]|nr:hypothetical protein EBESD8_23850 [Rhodococcus aetherivorans]